MGEEVEGDNFSETWDAIIAGQDFTVCYESLGNVCYSIPGWKANGEYGLIMAVAELCWWLIVACVSYKALKKRQKKEIIFK